MPITGEWANPEHTIMLLKFEGAWVFDEVWSAYNSANDIIRALDHEVHLIADHRLETEQPESIGALLPKFAELDIPPNMGLIIQVALKGSIRVGNELFSMMYRKIHLVDEME